MKKALKVIGAYVVLFVVCIIVAGMGDAAAGVAAAIFMISILAGLIALPVYIAYKVGRRKKSPGTAMQEEIQPFAQADAPAIQQPRPAVMVTKSSTVPQPVAPRPLTVHVSDGISAHYPGVGVFCPYVEVFERPDLAVGAIVTFRQEPENRFDSNAVAVVIGRKRIGYLFRGEYQNIVNTCLKAGQSVSGRISFCDPTKKNLKSGALSIDIYVYQTQEG